MSDYFHKYDNLTCFNAIVCKNNTMIRITYVLLFLGDKYGSQEKIVRHRTDKIRFKHYGLCTCDR